MTGTGDRETYKEMETEDKQSETQRTETMIEGDINKEVVVDRRYKRTEPERKKRQKEKERERKREKESELKI